MADGFSGSGFGTTSKQSQYAATAMRLAAAHKATHGDGGILGHIEGLASHLASDAVSTAEGFPAGIIHMATQSPVKSAKEIYAGEAQTWSPLLHGDYHTFVHNFYEHPLGPILDIAGLVTGGAGLAAKAGVIGELGEGGVRAIQVGSKAETIGRYADNPVIRVRQVAMDRLTRSFPKATPLLGEAARGARAMSRIQETKLAKDELLGNAYAHSSFKLNKSYKRTAYMTVNDGTSPLERLASQQKHIDKANEKIGKQHDEVLSQYDAKERILNEHLHIERASPADKLKHDKITSQLQAQMQKLDAKAKDLETQYQPMNELNERALSDPRAENLFHEVQESMKELREQHGYEAKKNPVRLQGILAKVPMSKDARDVIIARDAAKYLGKRDEQLRGISALQSTRRKYLHHLLDAGAQFLPDKMVSYRVDGETKLGELSGKKVIPISAKGLKSKGLNLTEDAYKKLDPLVAHEALEQFFPMDAPRVSRELWHPQGMDKLLKQVQTAHGKLDRAEPVYMPDKMMLNNPHKTRANKIQARPSIIKNHENAGMLYMAGLLSHDPLILAKHFMDDAMIAHTQDTAEQIIKHAEAHYGKEIPAGYVAVKNMGVKRGYMNDSIEVYQKEMRAHLNNGNPDGMVATFRSHHFTPSEANVKTAKDGHMLVIHHKYVDALMPEFKKSSAFMQYAWKKPSAIWKHIVLAGRPAPFIINNVVGNSVMYGLRNNDFASLHALFRSSNEERAFEETQPGSHLTFGHSVAVKRPTKATKVLNFAYDKSSAHEHLLRRATFLAAAKTMKVVKDAKRDLQDAGYDPAENDGKTLTHAALDKAEKEHGGVHAEIAKRIEDTMGDYHHFNKTEKGIRSIVPFYAWDRHAARAYYKLMTDKPLTAALMTHVGQLGSAQTNKMLGDVPAFMKNYVPMSVLQHLPGMKKSGDTAVLNTGVLNPEATIANLVTSVKALVSGNPAGAASSDLTSSLSPFITAPVEALTGKSLLTGAPLASNFGTKHGAIGAALGDIATNLPIPKLIASTLPGNIPGSSHKDMSLDRNKYTPTGKPKAEHQDTVSKNWQTQLLNTLFGIPAKDINVKASQTWEKSIKTAAAAAEFHVAKKRKSKTSSSIFGGGLK